MRRISTGEPATLGTYLEIAKVFGPKAEAFIQKKIDESPKGKDDQVIADERQVLLIFASMLEK